MIRVRIGKKYRINGVKCETKFAVLRLLPGQVPKKYNGETSYHTKRKIYIVHDGDFSLYNFMLTAVKYEKRLKQEANANSSG